jgi:four helix bundle protein
MPNYNSKFKTDLKQRCFQFSLGVIALSDKLPNKRSSWVVIDQLVRAATSVGANLVEAKGSSSRLEFKRFYEIALKSANETQYWLELLRDSKLAEPVETKALLLEIMEISNMLGASVLKLKAKNQPNSQDDRSL